MIQVDADVASQGSKAVNQSGINCLVAFWMALHVALQELLERRLN